MQEQINLNTLSEEQLDQLVTSAAIQIAQLELSKATALNSLAQILQFIEEQKQAKAAAAQPSIKLPKINKLNLPKVESTVDSAM